MLVDRIIILTYVTTSRPPETADSSHHIGFESEEVAFRLPEHGPAERPRYAAINAMCAGSGFISHPFLVHSHPRGTSLGK
jgi:hypothetical protein